jgi:light-regulated signal transduction histidine kinase (bacteriophytochrome)/CheY-like chemotaxis protein
LTQSEATEFPNGQASVDLTNCDREPIHILGRVQEFGALVAVSSDGIIQHASSNLQDALGFPADQVVGQPLGVVCPPAVMQKIFERSRSLSGQDAVVRVFGVLMPSVAGLFDLSIHQSGRHLVVEFERKRTSVGQDFLSEVYPYINRIRLAENFEAKTHEAARALRALSGFDSVMVYQFQPDASGKVVAQDRAAHMDDFKGLFFPASDIPKQARALYARSLLRLIADVDNEGVAIVPQTSAEGRPLDLSLSVTRAVSPIHLEYLRNMGVRASMSVSIMRNNELWGLFACHHATPKYIDFEARTAIELFGHLFSYELSHLEQQARATAEKDAAKLQTRLMSMMAQGEPLAKSLMYVSEDIQDVIPHDGLVLYSEGTYQGIGAVPTEDEFYALTRFLNTAAASGVYETHCLSQHFIPAEAYADRAAGCLAIPISRRPRDYLVLFRKEQRTKVTWAGNPEKPVTPGPNGLRLTPRKSFEAWSQVIRGQSAPWGPAVSHAADLLRALLLEIFLKITDQANEERKRAQEKQELLISELNHRVRNILNLMRGLIKQSKSATASVEDFSGRLDGRIHALARAHDQLTRDDWAPASLEELVRLEIAAYTEEKADRLIVNGDDVLISPKAYTSLALVVHELMTNSVKYGALREALGRIVLTLGRDHTNALTLSWVERGGPAVVPPSRRGFGSTIIERFVPFELNGEARLDYKVTGLEAHFVIPEAHVFAALKRVEGAVSEPATPERAPNGVEGTALVLEDTMIIAMDAADILTELGANDVKIASNVQEALNQIEKNTFSVAVLDVNLGNEQSLPVAIRLAEMGVPFILSTGYGERDDIRANYPPCPILRKPFSNETLAEAVFEAIRSNR